MAAGLAEHAVVQQEAGDLLAAGRGVDDLLQALVHHVAVALDGEDERVRPGPLDPGGQRRRPAVQRLQHLAVEVVGERGVAADAEDGDGSLDGVSFCDHLDDRAHGDRLAAAGAEVVGADVDELGREVVDESRAARRLGGRQDREHPLRSPRRRPGVDRHAAPRSRAVASTR